MILSALLFASVDPLLEFTVVIAFSSWLRWMSWEACSFAPGGLSRGVLYSRWSPSIGISLAVLKDRRGDGPESARKIATWFLVYLVLLSEGRAGSGCMGGDVRFWSPPDKAQNVRTRVIIITTPYSSFSFYDCD